MRRSRGHLAYREEFWAGRLGIRAKILIWLALLAAFTIFTVWLFQGALFYTIYGILMATGFMGFIMARSISEPIIETNLAEPQPVYPPAPQRRLPGNRPAE